MTAPAPPMLRSARLTLEPLHPDHAAEMVGVLSNPALYSYIGGRAPTREELKRRYAHQADGHARGWLNWIVREKTTARATGFVQATVTDAHTELAWVIGVEHQSRGYAGEAGAAMVAWLRTHGSSRLVAHVHSENRASQAVARSLGLEPTGTVVDGEMRWQSA